MISLKTSCVLVAVRWFGRFYRYDGGRSGRSPSVKISDQAASLGVGLVAATSPP